MRYVIYFIVILVNFVLARDLFGNLTLAGAIPNLNLLFVIIAAGDAGSDRPDFLFIAFAAGLLADIGSGLPIGTFSAAFILAGLASHLLFHGPLAVSDNWKHFGFAAAAGIVLTYFWVVLFSKGMAAMGIMPFSFEFSQLGRMIFFTLVYNLALAFPMFWLYNAVTRYVDQKINRSRHLR